MEKGKRDKIFDVKKKNFYYFQILVIILLLTNNRINLNIS